MKTFTATHLNKHAQEVFAAAKDGPVMIEHDRYEGAFTISHLPPLKAVSPINEIQEWDSCVVYEVGQRVMFNGEERVIVGPLSVPESIAIGNKDAC